MTGSAREILHIDWTKCDGRGLCTELIPDLLGRDKWGFPVVKNGRENSRSDVAVPRSQLDAATDAVGLCPVLALSIARA